MTDISIREVKQENPLINPVGNESNRHAKLKLAARDLLKDLGYDRIMFEACIEDGSDKRSPRADVIGKSGSEIACVECETGKPNNPSNRSSYQERTLDYPFDSFYIISEVEGRVEIMEKDQKEGEE